MEQIRSFEQIAHDTIAYEVVATEPVKVEHGELELEITFKKSYF
jgi:hypothetical protein